MTGLAGLSEMFITLALVACVGWALGLLHGALQWRTAASRYRWLREQHTADGTLVVVQVRDLKLRTPIQRIEALDKQIEQMRRGD